MPDQVAFIGLGVMGYPMAGPLQKAGFDVTVFNRTTAKADRWVAEYRGRSASSLAEAASGKSVVFTCVGKDDDLRQVTIGDGGALHDAAAGTVFLDHTTTSAVVARELSGCSDRPAAVRLPKWSTRSASRVSCKHSPKGCCLPKMRRRGKAERKSVAGHAAGRVVLPGSSDQRRRPLGHLKSHRAAAGNQVDEVASRPGKEFPPMSD